MRLYSLSRSLMVLTLGAALFSTPAFSDDGVHNPKPTTVSLNAEVSLQVVNDTTTITVYSEASAPNAATAADRVSRAIQAGLAKAKAAVGISVKSGPTSTYPVYDKDGKTIEAWRMRAELILEGHDAAALSKLVSDLPDDLVIGNLSSQPADATRQRAIDEASVAAIEAFRHRAGLLAAALGSKYRIQELTINTGFVVRPQVFAMARAKMAAERAPLPVEAGDSRITVTASGTIELLDSSESLQNLPSSRK